MTNVKKGAIKAKNITYLKKIFSLTQNFFKYNK